MQAVMNGSNQIGSLVRRAEGGGFLLPRELGEGEREKKPHDR
jgi:hypothetical protein